VLKFKNKFGSLRVNCSTNFIKGSAIFVLLNPLTRKKIKACLYPTAKSIAFGRFPGFARLPFWYMHHADGQYEAMVE
jgi:hypothetical protein